MKGEELVALLVDVRARLSITWSDDATDARLKHYIESGMAYLNDKLGGEGDYLAPGYPRTLLFEYVRYARDDALEVFEENYRSMILAMQNERAVDRFADQNTQA